MSLSKNANCKNAKIITKNSTLDVTAVVDPPLLWFLFSDKNVISQKMVNTYLVIYCKTGYKKREKRGQNS